MADIFISYSKPDRDKVAMLAAYLESEGWTVWWDKNLTAGEPYRDEIMRELVAARAVIVLWTPSSIKSDFVRAEAGRAKADGKLIPVKTDGVGYGNIPLPFGEMHTESLSSKTLIRAAVVAQLAKPAAQRRPLWLARKTLWRQALTWFGIVGSALTIFTGLRSILDLAAWAHWVVIHWQAWTHDAWQWLFALVHIRLPPHWTPLLNFATFGVSLAIGQRSAHAISQKAGRLPTRSDRAAISWGHALWAPAACGLPLFGFAMVFVPIWDALAIIGLFLGPFLILFSVDVARFAHNHGIRFIPLPALATASKALGFGMVVFWLIRFIRFVWLRRTSADANSDLEFLSQVNHSILAQTKLTILIVMSLMFVVTPFVYLVYASRDRLNTALSISIIMVFYAIVFVIPNATMGVRDAEVGDLAVILFYVIPAIMLTIAPINVLARRLVFLILGIAVLVGLNEIAKRVGAIRELLKLSA